MGDGVLVDSSAWGHYFRRNRDQPASDAALADKVRDLVANGDALIHPVVAGEVLLGGVDPRSAFAGCRWIDVSRWSAVDILEWLEARPREWRRGVGWADCQIVHGAVVAGVPLLTGDGGQRALWEAVRTG